MNRRHGTMRLNDIVALWIAVYGLLMMSDSFAEVNLTAQIQASGEQMLNKAPIGESDLNRGWMYRQRDVAETSPPSDLAAWTPVEGNGVGKLLRVPPAGNGSGWFRHAIQVSSQQANTPSAIMLWHWGDCVVYVDGRCVIPKKQSHETGLLSIFVPLLYPVYLDTGRHWIIVGMQSDRWREIRRMGYPVGFRLEVQDWRLAFQIMKSAKERIDVFRFGGMVTFLTMGALFLFFAMFAPGRHSHWWYVLMALCMACSVLMFYNEISTWTLRYATGDIKFGCLFLSAAFLSGFHFLQARYAGFAPRLSWHFSFLTIVVGVLIWISTPLWCMVLCVCFIIDVAWVGFIAVQRRHPESSVCVVSAFILTIGLVVTLFQLFGIIDLPLFYPVIPQIALLLFMSVHAFVLLRTIALNRIMVDTSSSNRQVVLESLRTEIRRKEVLECEIQKHILEMEQHSAMVTLGTLVSGVAHEINNPNNFILLSATTLNQIWKKIRVTLSRVLGEPTGVSEEAIELVARVDALSKEIGNDAQRIRKTIIDLREYAHREPAGDDSGSILSS